MSGRREGEGGIRSGRKGAPVHRVSPTNKNPEGPAFDLSSPRVRRELIGEMASTICRRHGLGIAYWPGISPDDDSITVAFMPQQWNAWPPPHVVARFERSDIDGLDIRGVANLTRDRLERAAHQLGLELLLTCLNGDQSERRAA